MNKTVLYICMSIFAGIGGYIPTLLGDTSWMSGWGILGSTIGGIVGVLVARKLSSGSDI
ncbi:hypothetical protein KC878_03775 [Candidatus Saccharibacteria bacterium]|nr:hypothetical protein [Candidatus Saccharibacteria bacterium]MCB9821728.1 hypothetical protein [Candidatus Nomurabacteria bacterium]